MPLYRIERQLPPVTEDEIEAAAFRGISCLVMFKDLVWVRSFYDPQTYHFTCYYEATDPMTIRQHAEMAALPCDSITEVVEYLPDQFR